MVGWEEAHDHGVGGSALTCHWGAGKEEIVTVEWVDLLSLATEGRGSWEGGDHDCKVPGSSVTCRWGAGKEEKVAARPGCVPNEGWWIFCQLVLRGRGGLERKRLWPLGSAVC